MEHRQIILVYLFLAPSPLREPTLGGNKNENIRKHSYLSDDRDRIMANFFWREGKNSGKSNEKYSKSKL